MQGAQTSPAHGLAQAVAADAMAFLAQGNLQPARAIAAFVVAKGLHQRRFPSRLAWCYALLLRLLPRVIPAGWYAQHVAEQAHGVRGPLPVEEAVAAHRLSGTESLRLKQATGNGFFKMSSFWACRRAKARS